MTQNICITFYILQTSLIYKLFVDKILFSYIHLKIEKNIKEEKKINAITQQKYFETVNSWCVFSVIMFIAWNKQCYGGKILLTNIFSYFVLAEMRFP